MANQSGNGEEQARAGHFHGKLLGLALVFALALAGLTALAVVNPLNAWDVAIARAIQEVNVGSLAGVFGVYQQIGGPYAVVFEAVLFAIVLALNWRAWRLLIAGVAVSGWYFAIVSLVNRPRPSMSEVLRVTEHPGHSSYPSGHMILFIFYAVILMTTLGMKYLPRWGQWLGWAIAVVFVLVGGFSRVYSGAHWPSDVLAGGLYRCRLVELSAGGALGLRSRLQKERKKTS